MSQERIDNLFASESWTAVYTAFTNVSLKAYDFDTIREALIEYVSISYPDKFNDFIASSEFIAVLDLVAYLGHSLSFRLDMNTRENFMDTAERRESILRMAKTLGYTKTRPLNARGFLKITSIRTDQEIFDNEGNSLANVTVNWNDSNNSDWYENFVDVINTALSPSSKIQDPLASMTASGVDNYIYELNQADYRNSVAFSFSVPLNGSNKRLEAVRAEFVDGKIQEAEPNESNRFTIINRNDNLGAASDRTGFFLYAKLGELQFRTFNYSSKLSNRIETIPVQNISNTDVWIQRIDTAGEYVSSVSKVDNDTRETAIYNSLRTGNSDIVSVNTISDNGIELHYGDGLFSNAASGNYRVWYRTVDNENFNIERNDISERTISIPYYGADGKTYRLTITLSSTKDFTENFAGESYASVRRIAPRAYYTQDRMVNAQDYNILPLSLGQSIVSKVKSVNTTYAGNSRYFEIDDVTGHHSNISITGTDGSVFIEDDPVTMHLYFNKENGNAVDFVRNELTKAVMHPSLVNLFYETYKDNPNAVINKSNNEEFKEDQYVIDPLDSKIVTVPNTTMGIGVWAGDFVNLLGDSGDEYWTRVHYGVGAPVSLGEFEVDDIIPEYSGNIVGIVRGYRTRFEDTEIAAIRSEKIETTEIVSSFIIKYIFNELTSQWEWAIHNEEDGELNPGSDVFLELEYNPGIRDSEAEYTVRFTGKRIVFESNEQVKFYYGNDDMVVDNETNLAERDKIVINYYDEDANIEYDKEITNDKVTLTHGCELTDIVEDAETATFCTNYKNTGAVQTLEFINGHTNVLKHIGPIIDEVTEERGTATTHYLVSPIGLEYEITPTTLDSTGNPTIIGESPEYKVCYTLDDKSSVIGGAELIEEDSVTSNSSEINYPAVNAVITTEDSGNTANAEVSFTTYSDVDLIENQFKGVASMDYFNDATESQNFIWVDQNELMPGTTIDDVIPPAKGIQTEFFTTYTGSNYVFEFPNLLSTEGFIINSLDQDVKWKQFAYGEINFVSDKILTQNNVILKDELDKVISMDHCELVQDGNNYKIIFWTYNPQVGSLIDVYKAGTEATDLSLFKVRVEANVEVTKYTEQKTKSYRAVESYVYDDYLTPAGYVDNTKVKLLSMDTTRNPHGIINIFNNDNIISYIVLENYIENNVEYKRVSNIAIATNDSKDIPDDALIWYNPELKVWQRKISGVWTPSFEYDVLTDEVDSINYRGTVYNVVEGRSYVEDPFMSYRWDHYADKDKRIDPSTSNIIDVYVLTSDYVRNIEEWVSNGLKENIPQSPNNFELRKTMESLNEKASISDHVSYIPVKFKPLFGEFADLENQAVFKIIKKNGTVYTDSEIKNVVAEKINTYFKLENWDFGEKFYFSELAAYLHSELTDYISSVVITPKYAGNDFKNLLSISCEPNEIFLSVVTSKDVKIISSIANNELTGE